MQTVLGAGGAIGRDLASALAKYSEDIRLVSRHPAKCNPNDQLMAADLTQRDQVFRAVEGSEVAYLTIGFPYRLKAWREAWPPLVRNVIEACRQYGSKLVFFDNIYMYDRDSLSPMTEKTVIRPSSKKGEIRSEIAGMISSAYSSREIQALIARSADFYGPGISTSVLQELVYRNLEKGKAAYWLIDTNRIHNFTYTPDAAEATAILGNTQDAYNQVWHLPTDGRQITGRQWVELFARALNVKPRCIVLSPWMLDVLGLFMPVMREINEMSYQYDRDYFFDSTKFNNRFNFRPTPPEEAVKAIVAKN